MNLSLSYGIGGIGGLTVLLEDGERVLCRGWRDDGDGDRDAVMAVVSSSQHPAPAFVHQLSHEYGLKDKLDGRSAARPLALVHEDGRTVLLLEDTGAEPLARFLGRPMEMGRFLRFAIGLSGAVRHLHERGLIHKDIKPANALVDSATGHVWLTGFGIAARLPRERQSPEPPELVAGTLAYMAPEQTGRMNRSIDSRSDLYSLGVTLYEMLTGALPFVASDPMEWIHCHIARRPVPPKERLKDVPAPISAIVSKLLAKTAEERYQTAAGLERDLRRCLAEWENQRRIRAFPLGQQDTSDRLWIPEKLYGREREIETLLDAFDQVVTSGQSQLVLVSGYSGIGKSAVVNELHKALVPPRGLFASGKFDQYKRDIPYATLAQAFRSLIRSILGKSDVELAAWRDALREALDPNAWLMTDVVPELKLLVGEQPPVQELSPQQAQGRLQLAFRRFLGVFARHEHPLVLFLDDLQWLDAATLDLLVDLLARGDVHQLLVIGAYRDNEVDSTHPLMRRLDTIRKEAACVQEISLAPLAREDLERLIVDTLSCPPHHAAPLARLVHEKTGGNPFFAIQFISTLVDEGLLRFDHDVARWCWELDHLHAKGYTDNVVDLMVRKLIRLPVETQAALQQFACLGNVAEIGVLSMVLGKSDEDLRSDLWDALSLGLIEQLHGSYKFVHDRVQEAAYSLIPDRLRAEAHLHIGRLLTARTPAEKREENIFEIVNQLNRGATLIASHDEREQVAELNLLAGRRAKATTAYASALTYLTAGEALLPEDSWERRHDLTFALSIHRAECEFLTGALAEAEHRLLALSVRAANTVERAMVACLRVDLHTALDQSSRAIAVGLDYLQHLGIDWSPHPTEEEARREYERIWSQLEDRTIESLIDLPLMRDPEQQAAMQVLSTLLGPAYFTDFQLFCLLVCRMVNVSMQHGMCGASAHAYGHWGIVLGPVFHRYREGYRSAKLACDLAEKHGFTAYRAKVYRSMGIAALWTQPIATARDFNQAAFRAAIETGDLTYACYSVDRSILLLLLRNDPLDAVWRESERSLEFVRKAGYSSVADNIVSQQRFIANMQGRTATFSTFGDSQFDEAGFEAQLKADRSALTICWYWILKLKARFLSGDYTEALAAANNAKAVLWIAGAHIHLVEYSYYTALTVAALYGDATSDEQNSWRALLMAHRQRLREWAENYPPTFADKNALVSAEIARLEGRDADAMRLYEEAIRFASDYGFVQSEGLAHEVAARFYNARGFQTIGNAFLRKARYCYLRWGAHGKVRQLERLYPQLTAPEGHPTAALIDSPLQQLDLASVVKASQAVSSEIVLPKLVERLMTIAVENAGADRALLILPIADGHFIQSEARATGDRIEVVLYEERTTGVIYPESIVRYVIRAREIVILDDTSKPNIFSEDDYLRGRPAKSILCVPLIKQGQLTALLYLENTLSPYVFSPHRIAMIELLAAQAAISLENTRLYSDLQVREAKVRRLVDSNIIGISIWDFDGRIIDANEAFLRIVGHSRDDLVSGHVQWKLLTPAEWREADEQALTELRATGTYKPREKEYLRKDGSRVPVLVGAAALGAPDDQGVAFVLDLTERKEAEQNLRETEQRYREAQAELAHVVRVTTLGELTASIAHEVKQPIGATVTNAQAALRFLDADLVDRNLLREILRDIVKDGNRAGDVVNRIKDLTQKAPARRDRLEMNGAIREVIELVRGEAVKNRVSVRAELANDLPLISGDRVQLQQVILNLMMNGIEAMQSVEDRPRELVIQSVQGNTQQIRIGVMDNGVGFSAENADRLFAAFFTTKPNGMGMGLSICRSIVEAHNGHLLAIANASHGATFQFTLPAIAQK